MHKIFNNLYLNKYLVYKRNETYFRSCATCDKNFTYI